MDSTIYMEVLLVIYFVRYVLLNMLLIHCIMILSCSRGRPFVQFSCGRGAQVDCMIYIEVLLVIYFVRINRDRLKRGPGVTVSFKPTQRRNTLVTLPCSTDPDGYVKQIICCIFFI